MKIGKYKLGWDKKHCIVSPIFQRLRFKYSTVVYIGPLRIIY